MRTNQINQAFTTGRFRWFVVPGTNVTATLVGISLVCSTAFGAEPVRTSSAVTPSTPASANEKTTGTSIVLKSSSTEIKRAVVDPETLAGQGGAEVESALGKPSGKLQTAQGATWLYSEWRVQFDHAGKVAKVEKDQPVRLAKVDPKFLAAADAVAKAEAERAAADDVARIKAALPAIEDVRVISNGGAQVDLLSLLAEDKVTIVDFFADWCVPCQRLGPRLEQLAKADPDVVLLKVNIVNWQTPITTQFGITSIPSVRVFNRSKAQVGDATPNFDTILGQVRQAKGT